VVAALVVAACTDGVGPRPPLFSFSPNGVTVSAENGSLNQRGREFRKGFDPRNPHLGDAVIVNVYWLGSRDIVDSVTDVLNDANSTRVGNQYHRVEYVTAGGYSMATYVATNIQNFGDSDTTLILVVRAHLADSATDGGLKITAWSGVEDVFTQALGAVSSDTGSDTTITDTHAGPIAVDAGALAYTVTMAAPAGLSPPGDPFQPLGQGSDNFIKEQAAYAVPANATTVDPRWTWFFGPERRTWLATTLALNPEAGTPPPPGNLTVSNSTTGSSFPASYTVTVDAGTVNQTSQSILPNGSVTFTGLAAGSHSVTLTVATNCTVTSANPQTVSVPSGATGTASFAVSCTTPNSPPVVNAGPDETALTGLLYSLRWSFSDANSNGPWSYRIEWGDGSTSTGSVSSQGTFTAGHTYFVLLPRTFTIRVTVTDSRGASGSDTKVVTIVL
jgi:hypothetical protein